MPRFFAHCDTKGCRAARPFMASTFPDGRPFIRTEFDREDLINASAFRPKGIEAPMRRRGIWCEAHGPMRVEVLNAKVNPSVPCDARCTGAKRASCECSCGGENHGSQF
jgi:hypothetical protein